MQGLWAQHLFVASGEKDKFPFLCHWTKFKRLADKQVLTEEDGSTPLCPGCPLSPSLCPVGRTGRTEEKQELKALQGCLLRGEVLSQLGACALGRGPGGTIGHEHGLQGATLYTFFFFKRPYTSFTIFPDLKSCAWSLRAMLIHHGASLS